MPELLPGLRALRELAMLDEQGHGVALTRLAKALDVGVSILLRQLTPFTGAHLGGEAGPDWVRLACEGGRWTATLTDTGRAQCAVLCRPVLETSVQRTVAGRAEIHTDQLAVEAPVALVFNGISHAVMMASPGDLEAFAIGFALSEGLLLSRRECYGIELHDSPEGIELHLQVAAAADARLKERRRSLAGVTGCGLCGIDSLKAVDLSPLPLNIPAWVHSLDATTVLHAFEQLPALQPLNALTGACHAAAWADASGELVAVMEDVGRHNALDKLLGQRALLDLPFDDGFVLMTSRASFELVRKCARLHVPVLAAISAPTSLALDVANQAGMQLFGFCRADQAVRYTRPLHHAADWGCDQ